MGCRPRAAVPLVRLGASATVVGGSNRQGSGMTTVQRGSIVALAMVLFAIPVVVLSSGGSEPPPPTTTPPQEFIDVSAPGGRTRAAEVTQDDLRDALTAFKVFYTDARSYLVTAQELQEIEPRLKFVEVLDENLQPGEIYFESSRNRVFLVAVSQGDFWLCMRDVTEGSDVGTFYGSGMTWVEVREPLSCSSRDPW